MKLTAHMIVRNEDQWIWYAIRSVLNQVEKIIIFDTGSKDKTVDIINSFKTKKIISKRYSVDNSYDLVKLRQEQVEMTKTKWFMLVDGDEVWSKKSLTKVKAVLSKVNTITMAVVVRTRMCVGDIWHYQLESAGRYKIFGRQGHFNIRFYKKDHNFSWQGKYPNEAYTNLNGQPVHQITEGLIFINTYYWHLSHLKRSSLESEILGSNRKFKLEFGIKAKKQDIPEIFFEQRPDFVTDALVHKYNCCQWLVALMLTPALLLKRKIIK